MSESASIWKPSKDWMLYALLLLVTLGIAIAVPSVPIKVIAGVAVVGSVIRLVLAFRENLRAGG